MNFLIQSNTADRSFIELHSKYSDLNAIATMKLSEIEREVICLSAVKEFVDSMVNNEVLYLI